MIYTYILLYVCTASFIPIHHVLGHKKFGLRIQTQENTILTLQDSSTIFAGGKTPIWKSETDASQTDMIKFTLLHSLMSKVIRNFNDYGENVHVQRTNLLTSAKRYYFPEGSDGTCNARRNTFNKNGQIDTSDMGDVIYPKILVFVDKPLFKHFGDPVELITYVLTLLNGVDLNFRELEKPKVRLNIAGIVVININKKELNTNKRNFFLKFLTSLENNAEFKSREFYDIAIFIKAKKKEKDTCNIISDDACSMKNYFNAVVFDDMKFSGIRHLTVSLAHLFGAQADGIKSPTYQNGPDSKNCNTDGYLMGHLKNVEQQFLFSSCSKQMMSYYFSLTKAKCLRKNPGVGRKDRQVLRILPGKFMSLDEQCQTMGYTNGSEPNLNVCLNLQCIQENQLQNTYVPALDGTYCGNKKYCIRGKCVKIRIVNREGDISITHYFPPQSQSSTESPVKPQLVRRSQQKIQVARRESNNNLHSSIINPWPLASSFVSMSTSRPFFHSRYSHRYTTDAPIAYRHTDQTTRNLSLITTDAPITHRHTDRTTRNLSLITTDAPITHRHTDRTTRNLSLITTDAPITQRHTDRTIRKLPLLTTDSPQIPLPPYMPPVLHSFQSRDSISYKRTRPIMRPRKEKFNHKEQPIRGSSLMTANRPSAPLSQKNVLEKFPDSNSLNSIPKRDDSTDLNVSSSQNLMDNTANRPSVPLSQKNVLEKFPDSNSLNLIPKRDDSTDLNVSSSQNLTVNNKNTDVSTSTLPLSSTTMILSLIVLLVRLSL